jgi:hypothetical protein
MDSKTKLQAISRITEIDIGLEESAVVQVEGGDAMGYLIAEAYSVGELPSEITLRNLIYLRAQGADVETAKFAEVLVSAKNDYWMAVETGEVLVIPCPAREPYPIVFISKHGFIWMQDLIRHGDVDRVLEHLNQRFAPCRFLTSREILHEPSSPFFAVSCIRPTPLKMRG